MNRQSIKQPVHWVVSEAEKRGAAPAREPAVGKSGIQQIIQIGALTFTHSSLEVDTRRAACFSWLGCRHNALTSGESAFAVIIIRPSNIKRVTASAIAITGDSARTIVTENAWLGHHAHAAEVSLLKILFESSRHDGLVFKQYLFFY